MHRVAGPVRVHCRAGVLFVLLSFVASIDAWGDGRGAMPVITPPDEQQLKIGVIHRIIDGDSVELFLDGQIVRYELAGADAPDVVDEDTEEGAESTSPMIRGSSEARAYLHQLLDGEQVGVVPDLRKPRDARGHARAYLYRMPDRLLVNLEMVRLGMARHARDPSSFNDAAMVWAQDRARDARKGVWAPTPKSDPSAAVVASSPAQETTENPVEAAPQPVPQRALPTLPEADPGIVYITKSGSKYHRKDCQHVKDSGIPKRRDQLDESHSACKVCDPDDPRGD